MYDVLELYARPYRSQEPVICIDEKSKPLIRDSREGLPMKPGAPAKYDYEYVREGTCNVFVAVEPKGGRRVVEVTERRTKPEFVGFVRQLLERTYASARKVHLVLDNLNTHFRSCFDEVLGPVGCPRAAAPRAVSPHAQACELVEHGGDRDQHPGSSMPRATFDGPGDRAARDQYLETPTQCRTARH